jgi:hypothetical protein
VTERLLDREAVGRVLRRAGELTDDPRDGLWDPGGVSERALIDAAVEVGIPEAAVRRALAEERLDPRPRRRVGDRLVGARVHTVDAEVAGSPSHVLASIDAWFVDGHHLRRDRLHDRWGVWTKRRGIVGRVVRLMRTATGEGRLSRVRRVGVSTAQTGTGTTVVRLAVDQSAARHTAAAGAIVATLAGVVSAVLAFFTSPVLLVVIPMATAAGVGAAGRARSQSGQIAGEIDRVLDAVDHGVAPVRLRMDIVQRMAGRSFRPPVLGERRGRLRTVRSR